MFHEKKKQLHDHDLKEVSLPSVFSIGLYCSYYAVILMNFWIKVTSKYLEKKRKIVVIYSPIGFTINIGYSIL